MGNNKYLVGVKMKLHKVLSQRKTLADSIYGYLRDEIISLRLQPGQMIYENELAASLGVSRTPVREAFRFLLAEEFIEVLPQRGARIAYISKRKIEEAWFVRESLEVSAFKMVARNWDNKNEYCKEMHDKILRNLEDQKRAAFNNDYVEFFLLDEAYHKIILEQAGNLTLLSVITQMRGHLNRMRYLELHETKHTNKIVSDHEEIFNAIISGDEGKTETLLINHLRHLPNHSPKIMERYPNYFQVD
jgi:DNA-binding GntR family transcriptional regulator